MDLNKDSNNTEAEEAVEGFTIQEHKFDHVIEAADLDHEPIKLKRPTRDDIDTKNSTVHSSSPSNSKVDIVPAFREYAARGDTNVSAGSVLTDDLQEYGTYQQDKDISIHELLSKADVNVHEVALSESIKAFFGGDKDTTDAGRETGPSYEYNMNHQSRGCFIIFNHMYFLPHLGVNSRKGTHEDAKNLKKTALKLGFEYVRILEDLNVKDIKSWIMRVSKADHTNYDCFAMAILTHGDEGDILYAHDAKYHLDEITEPFMARNCPSLAKKPKMFFIQACRGMMLDDGALVTQDTVDAGITKVSNQSEQESMIIPNAADFLLAFSTVPGYYAWRNQACGSWFIQALCKCLSEFGDQLELMQIMTRVNRMVAYDFTSYSREKPDFHGKKQIPSVVTRLTHEVFFKKKKKLPPSRQQEHRLPATAQKKLGSTSSATGTKSLSHLKGVRETDL